jgi:hypothetical protein
MMKWHRGELEISLLQESGILKPKRFPDTNVNAYRSWSTWQIKLAPFSKTSVAVEIMSDGERIGRGHVAHLSECGTPYVKFGIFRPGNTWSGNETSIVQFRKISLKPLNPRKKIARTLKKPVGKLVRKVTEPEIQSPLIIRKSSKPKS